MVDHHNPPPGVSHNDKPRSPGLAAVPSALLEGIDGHPVNVEVHVGDGLPGYSIVGVPDVSCRQSRDRVRAAILSSGLAWPHKRVTVSLSPAGLRVHGAALDLPIALGLLAASGQVPATALDRLGAVGELGPDGAVRPVPGLISLAGPVAAPRVIVPATSTDEAALARPGHVLGAGALSQVVAALTATGPPLATTPAAPLLLARSLSGGLAQVRGVPMARQAVEIAAAGGHHLLLVGPPGSGKSILARSLVDLLPDLDPAQAEPVKVFV